MNEECQRSGRRLMNQPRLISVGEERGSTELEGLRIMLLHKGQMDPPNKPELFKTFSVVKCKVLHQMVNGFLIGTKDTSGQETQN